LESTAARIIGWDLSVYAQNIVINKGGKDGITKGQAVICHQGLIGQIVDEPGRVITRDRAPVLMITDPTSRVSVIVDRTRDRAILQGVGRDDRMLLVYLPPDAKIEKGDELSTSGLGGIFPPGIKAGTVIKIEYNAMFGSVQGWVKPSVDLNHLEDVLVVMNKLSNPMQATAETKAENMDAKNKN
jgi:rod shape-determining protein MreC